MTVGAPADFAALVVEEVLDFGALVGSFHFEIEIHGGRFIFSLHDPRTTRLNPGEK